MFRGMLQRGLRVKILRIMRWGFRLRSNLVLRVEVFRRGDGWEVFYARVEGGAYL
jgi:hypothetical protein